jgi:osmotically-inducible protein OsmY
MNKMTKKFLPIFVIGLLTYGTISSASPQWAQDDAKITAFIANKIAEIKPMSKYNVDVKTENHNVTFAGVVNTMEDAHAIVEIATPLFEVNKIDISHLKIKDASA